MFEQHAASASHLRIRYGTVVTTLFIVATLFSVPGSAYAQPILPVQWSTYLGGSADDRIRDLCVDKDDNVYVCGVFTSPDFPEARGVPTSFDTSRANGGGYLASFSPTGELRWMQYFGCVRPNEIAVSDEGILVMVGALAAECSEVDVTVSTFTTSGERFARDVLFGGSEEDIATSVDIVGGTIYVGGITRSADFPSTSNAFQSALNDDPSSTSKGDGFVAKLKLVNSPSGWLIEADVVTYFGGRNLDEVLVVRVRNSLGHVYVGGRTRSDKLPGQPVLQPSRLGTVLDDDGFVARLDSATLVCQWSTFCGGSGNEVVYGLQPVRSNRPGPGGEQLSLRVCGVYSQVSFPYLGDPSKLLQYTGGTALGGDAFLLQISDEPSPSALTLGISTEADDILCAFTRRNSNTGPLLFTNGPLTSGCQNSGFNACRINPYPGSGTNFFSLFCGNSDELVLDAEQARFGFGGIDEGSNSSYICGSTTSTVIPGTDAPGPIFQRKKAGNGRNGFLAKVGCGASTTLLTASKPVLCVTGDSATLSLAPAPDVVAWTDGITTPTRVVRSPGTYKVSYKAGGCDFLDSVVIRRGVVPSGRLEPTGVVVSCDPAGVVLTIRDAVGVSRILWSNGQETTDTTIRVDKPGLYSATLISADGCALITATVVVSSVTQTKLVSSDSALCEQQGETAFLSLQPAPESVRWEDGLTEPTRVVASPGTYRVRYTVAECDIADSIVIRKGLVPSGRLDPVGTISLCDTQGIQLTIRDRSNTDMIRWSNGNGMFTSDTSIRVRAPGTYNATLYSADGCTVVTDTVTIVSGSSGGQSNLRLSFAGADSAAVNETVEVILRIPVEPGTSPESLPTKWSAVVRFDKTMLFPLPPLDIGTTDDTLRSIKISGERSPPSDTLGTFELAVALGERDSTAITVDSLVFDPCNTTPKPTILPFRTAGICRLDSVGRFLTTRQPPLRTSVISNPVGSDGAVGYATGVDLSRAKARIVTLLGEEVNLDTIENTGSSASWSIPPSLPSGRYLFVVHTGSAVASSTFEVVR